MYKKITLKNWRYRVNNVLKLGSHAMFHNIKDAHRLDHIHIASEMVPIVRSSTTIAHFVTVRKSNVIIGLPFREST